MNGRAFRTRIPDLGPIAAAAVTILAVVAAAAVAYLLLDVLLIFFVGVIVAAALQPWHAMLVEQWGIPKGMAVLLLYLVLLLGLVLVALAIGPVLIEQLGNFAGELPK